MLRYIYYQIRPLIPRYLQIALRRKRVLRKKALCADVWPIDEKAGDPPEKFSGWPARKKFAVVLTHDVETSQGHSKSYNLIELEKKSGFRSSFSFVPKRYSVSPNLRNCLASNGFEIVVHGLYHDGKLYESRKIFRRRALEINRYLRDWKAVGFRSPSMHKNLEWIHDINIEYDSSTFDTDPFEPEEKGVKTIFPFCVSKDSADKGYVELPYTLPQDFTLFVIMKERTIDIWKQKLDWIAKKGGMALIVTHPDYMNFGDSRQTIEEYPVEYYIEFLNYIKERYKGQYWHVLPREMAGFWVNQNNLSSNAKIF